MLLAFGINHKTASVGLRERVVFAPDRLSVALSDARQAANVDEVAILSTCNRTELYCTTKEADCSPILSWLGDYHKVQYSQVRKFAYEFWNESAVRHLSRVASGLDSMVLGEPQILGQLKSAYSVAHSANTIGPELGRLFQHSFAVAKQVRSSTSIGNNPVSVAFAAVSLAQHIFSSLSQSTVLLIGAGETVDLAASHLSRQGVKNIVVANRTLERAKVLADKFNGRAITLEDIPGILPEADIVISSTASPLPILGKGTVESALKLRKYKPVFMMDIAVPRDIEPAVGKLRDVYLYTIDDLQQVADDGRKKRVKAAKKAETIVETRTSEYMDNLRGLDAVETIRRYRDKAEQIRASELEKALQSVRNGVGVDDAMQRMSKSLVNKMMHDPSIHLKKAGIEGRSDLLDWSHQLLGLGSKDQKPD